MNKQLDSIFLFLLLLNREGTVFDGTSRTMKSSLAAQLINFFFEQELFNFINLHVCYPIIYNNKFPGPTTVYKTALIEHREKGRAQPSNAIKHL